MTLASQNSIPYTGLTNGMLVIPVSLSTERVPYFGNIPFTGQSNNYKSVSTIGIGIKISFPEKIFVPVHTVLGYIRSFIREKVYPAKPTQATFHSTKDTITPEGVSFARFLIFKLLSGYTIDKWIVVPALSVDLLPTAA